MVDRVPFYIQQNQCTQFNFYIFGELDLRYFPNKRLKINLLNHCIVLPLPTEQLIVSSLLKIKYVELQKMKRTFFYSFERTITQ